VLCDGLYSGRTVIEPPFIGRAPGPALLMRQALHAAALSIDHPLTRQRLEFTAPLADDMQAMLDALRNA
jgi:23S rRNA pseudouridine1911/1915/1917 synthase